MGMGLMGILTISQPASCFPTKAHRVRRSSLAGGRLPSLAHVPSGADEVPGPAAAAVALRPRRFLEGGHGDFQGQSLGETGSFVDLFVDFYVLFWVE